MYIKVPNHRLKHMNFTPTFNKVGERFIMYSDGTHPLQEKLLKGDVPEELYMRKVAKRQMYKELQTSWSADIKYNVLNEDIESAKGLITTVAGDTIFDNAETILPEQMDACQGMVKTLIENSNTETIRTMIELSDVDYGTLSHSIRCMTLSINYGLYKGWSKREINNIAMAALCHDIGKSKIPIDILTAPRMLMDHEFEIMKTHTLIGSRMLSKFNFGTHDTNRTVVDAARYHHEKLDGSGYHGLKYDNISPTNRLLAIIDCHEALTADGRTYRDPVDLFGALTIIKNDIGDGKFDRHIFESYVTHFLK